MKTVVICLVVLSIIWIPVFFDVFSWRIALIMTILLSAGAYLIDKYILNIKKEKKDKNSE